MQHCHPHCCERTVIWQARSRGLHCTRRPRLWIAAGLQHAARRGLHSLDHPARAGDSQEQRLARRVHTPSCLLVSSPACAQTLCCRAQVATGHVPHSTCSACAFKAAGVRAVLYCTAPAQAAAIAQQPLLRGSNAVRRSMLLHPSSAGPAQACCCACRRRQRAQRAAHSAAVHRCRRQGLHPGGPEVAQEERQHARQRGHRPGGARGQSGFGFL